MLSVLLALALAFSAPALARTVTDSAGRVVEVPDEVNTVFAAGPPASVLVYVMKPEALTGWPRALYPEEEAYIAEPYRNLPETGRLTGCGGEANLERVLKIAPDLIIDFGSIRDTYVDLADCVQEQTGIPYILIDGRFENTPEALRMVGEILGTPERGEELARDVEETFARIDAMLAEVPEEQRPRTYLARSPDGLETGTKGSINTEIIERVGGRNVADDGGATRGLVQASAEQVLAAGPEVIVTWDRNFFDRVWDDSLWRRCARAASISRPPLPSAGSTARPRSIG